jgi:surfactin synthase thioesterase subunit
MPASAISKAVMQLLWIGGDPGFPGWCEGLGPQVELAESEAALDGRPYAIAGSGHGALTGLELAARLTAARLTTGGQDRHQRPPAQLIVAGCPPLPADAPVTACAVTAFAVAGDDLDVARACSWSNATSSAFGLRLLPSQQAWQSPGELTLLSLKEELKVWPA